MPDSSRPGGLQNARLPGPSQTPGAYTNSCPLSRWCQPNISSCRPFLLPPSIFPSIRVLSNESVLRTKWPKYWSFSFNISLSNEYSGLISFSMDWMDHLAIQGTLKSILQHHSFKASILQHSALFMVQLSHPYMTTEKKTSFDQTDVCWKVTSLLYNMLSRLVVTFLPRSKRVLISWLQLPPAVIWKPPKI